MRIREAQEHMDPDPGFGTMVHLYHSSKIKSHKKNLQNSRNQGFSYNFCFMVKGSGAGSVTNGSGCGFAGGPETYGSPTLVVDATFVDCKTHLWRRWVRSGSARGSGGRCAPCTSSHSCPRPVPLSSSSATSSQNRFFTALDPETLPNSKAGPVHYQGCLRKRTGVRLPIKEVKKMRAWVHHCSVGSASPCCTAGKSPILGSAPSSYFLIWPNGVFTTGQGFGSALI